MGGFDPQLPDGLTTYPDLDAFYKADSKREFSPEWDYGVMWRGESRFPLWRVSWVVETGEVYAVRAGGGGDRVLVLGLVPAEGTYPHGAGHESWAAWKDAQLIEKVMDGWSDQPHRKLAWVTERLKLVTS